MSWFERRPRQKPAERVPDPVQSLTYRVLVRGLAREERRFWRMYRSAESLGTLLLGCLTMGVGLFALVIAAAGLTGQTNPRWYDPTYLVWEPELKARVFSRDEPIGRLAYRVIEPHASLALLPLTGLALTLLGLMWEWSRRERISRFLLAGTVVCMLTLVLMFGPLLVLPLFF